MPTGRPVQVAAPLFGEREWRFEDVDIALERGTRGGREAREHPMSPAESGVLVDAEPSGCRAERPRREHFAAERRQEIDPLQVGQRRAGEVAEGAPAADASVALTVAEPAPALDVASAAVHAVDPVAESKRPHSFDDRGIPVHAP